MDFLNAIVALSNFVIIPAIAYGSQLALGALGVTLIYGILRFSNFAHGDTMAFGAMIAVLVTWWLQGMGVSLGPLPTALLALPFAILGCIALLLITDRFVYRFYRAQKAKPVILVIVSMGVMFIMNGLVRFIIGPNDQKFLDGERFIISVREFKAMTGLREGLAIKTTQGITVVVLLQRAEQTPLVIGAPGSPLELSLGSLYFRADTPATLSWAEVAALEQTGFARAIPLYYRFRAQQHPIVGTTPDYFDFRGLRLAAGRQPALLGEAVIGAAVAEAGGLGVGDHVISSPESVFDLAGVYPAEDERW